MKEADLHEYESGVLKQTLSQSYAFRNSVIFLCVTRTISATSENTSDVNFSFYVDSLRLLVNNIEDKITEFLNEN